MKVNGKLAVDTNAVIAYREGISEVCTLIDEADVIILPVTVLGELLYGALNSAKVKTNEHDIWIAAACLELEVPLLNQDGHFNFVDGLKVINWDKIGVI